MKHGSGKLRSKLRQETLERRLLMLTGGGRGDQADKRGRDYDKFFDNVTHLCRKPRHREIALNLARSYIGDIGLKNFYRLAEFLKEDIGKDMEITTGRFYSDLNNAREDIKQYLKNNIRSDALVYMVSYEKEDGRMKKINDCLLRTLRKDNHPVCRDIHKSDFPEKEGGILEIYVKEEDTNYMLQVHLRKTKQEEWGVDGNRKDQYVAVIKPLSDNKYPAKFQMAVVSR